jgi:hypothetical protein
MALTLAALTVAGVVIAVRASRSPEPAPKAVPLPVPVAAYKPVHGQLASVSVGPNGQALAAGYMCGECGTQATNQSLIVEQNGPAWSRVAIPGNGGWSRLTSISISMDRTIYAVGYACQAHCGTTAEVDRPLILRWSGKWSRLVFPGIPGSARLTGVSVSTTGTVFAVGYTCVAHCALKSEIDQPLILRSDGSTWWRMESSSLPPRGVLWAVSTQSGENAWAVGGGCTPGCGNMLILHWDGSRWSQVTSQSPGQDASLFAISTTATDGWASGLYCSARCHSPKPVSNALILRWNGHSWLQSPGAQPDNLLFGISAEADGTAWAAGAPQCGPCGSPPVYDAGLLRWNGSDWSRVPSPFGNLLLTGIVAERGGDAVAVGHECMSGCDTVKGAVKEVDRTVLLRLNGSGWSVVR